MLIETFKTGIDTTQIYEENDILYYSFSDHEESMVPKWTNINDQLNTGKTQKMLILTSEKVTVVRNEIALNAKATIVSLRLGSLFTSW